MPDPTNPADVGAELGQLAGSDPELDAQTDSSGPVTSPEQNTADGNSSPGPVTSPSQLDTALGQTTAPQPQAASGSASFRGVTPAGIAVQSGTWAKADKATAEYAKQQAGVANTEMQRSDDAYRGVQSAIGEQRQLANQFADDLSHLMAAKVTFLAKQAQDEKQIAQTTAAERANYVSMYRQQLAAVAQLSQSTGNPLANMGRGQAIGLMGAEFAEGFLAARGIHINPVEQIDKWVDRSMQEHQLQLENARGAANDTLHLYDIARQSSQDDFEARQRYRGFVLEGMSTAIQGQTDVFKSRLAAAQADQAMAQIGVEATATERGIADQYANRVFQVQKLNTERANDEIRNGIMQAELELKRRELALRAALAKPKPSEPVSFIEDVSNVKRDASGNPISGGKALALPMKGRENELAKYGDEVAAYNELKKNVEAYSALRSQMSTDELLEGTRSSQFRRLQELAGDVYRSYAYAKSGKQISEKELEGYKDNFANDKLWQEGDNANAPMALLLTEQNAMGARYQALVATGAVKELSPDQVNQLSPGYVDKDGYRVMPSHTVNPAGDAVDNAFIAGDKPVPSAIGQEYEIASGRSAKNYGMFGDGEQTGSRLFKFITTETAKQLGISPSIDYDGRLKSVDNLALALVDPAAFRAAYRDTGLAAGSNDDTIRNDASDALQRLTMQQDITGRYASAVLQLYVNAPDTLQSLLPSTDYATKTSALLEEHYREMMEQLKRANDVANSIGADYGIAPYSLTGSDDGE